MSINTAFYQIARNVEASDLAEIIGAKITGIEITETEKGIIKDIASFHSASASTLVYQTDPELLDGFKINETIIITNEAGAAAAGPQNICLVVPLPRVGFARAVDHLISKPDFGPSVSGVSPQAMVAPDTLMHPVLSLPLTRHLIHLAQNQVLKLNNLRRAQTQHGVTKLLNKCSLGLPRPPLPHS